MPEPPKSLFDHHREEQLQRGAPLAARMRPRTLDEFVGQEHLVGEGRVLRRSIDADQLPSIIQTSQKLGMQHMEQMLKNLAMTGRIDVQEAKMYASSPDLFDDRISK